MIQKTFALTNRALRVDSRSLFSHATRLGFALFVLFQFVGLSIAFSTQAPGRAVFKNIVSMNAWFASFIVPLLFANAITEEKEERTLALLKVANVSGLTIVAGKSIPRMTSLLLILFVQLPFSMLAITLGGVTPTQVLACYLAITTYAFFIGCLALWCSVIYRQTSNAVGLAGLLIFGYHVVPWVLFGTFTALSNHPTWSQISKVGIKLLDYHWSTNIFTQLPKIMMAGSTEGILSWQVGSNFLAGVFFFLLAWACFEPFNREVDSAPVKRQRRRSRKLSQTSRSGRCWKAAIVWKDFKFLTGGIKIQIAKMIIYGGVLLLFGGFQSEWNLRRLDLSDVMAIFAFSLFFIFMPLEIVLVMSRMFHREVKDKTISSLIMLPTPLWKIAYAKIGALLVSLLPALAWLALAMFFLPNQIVDFVRGFNDSMPWGPLIAMNVVAHVLLYLHLVVYLSLSMNSWWAIVVAYLVHYFGMMVPVYIGMACVMALGINPSEEMGMFVSFVAAIFVFVLVWALHRWIGESLKKKAAAD